MPSERAVIFDMDGVLVDSADAHRQAWRQLGDEVGVPFTDDLFRRTFGQRNETILPTWLGSVSPESLLDLGDRKEIIYRDLVRHGAVRVYRRIPDLLVELREAGAALAVASSGPKENVALLVETIGAFDLVDAAISADDVTEGKPHPAPFLAAAAHLGVDARRSAVIEDSVHGIEAAKRADMLAVAVLTSTPREALVKAGADVIVGEVADIAPGELLETIARRAR